MRFCFFYGNEPRPVVQRNLIEGNHAPDGAGILCADVDSLTFEECLIADNIAGDQGGGLHVHEGTNETAISLVRCTLENNIADEGSVQPGGGGVYVHITDGRVDLLNCIVSSNVACGLVASTQSPPNAIVSDYSDIWNNSIDNYWGCAAGSSSISLDPQFCALSAPVFWSLHSESPCVGSGMGGEDMGAFGIGCGATDVVAHDAPLVRPRLMVYPNPVFSRAEFIFAPRANTVALEIYDPQGRLAEMLRPSNGRFNWNPGSDAPSGVYFARLRGAGVAEVAKFVVVR